MVRTRQGVRRKTNTVGLSVWVSLSSVKSASWRCHQKELVYCYPTVDEQLCIQGLISQSKAKSSSVIQEQVTVSSGVCSCVALIAGKGCESDTKWSPLVYSAGLKPSLEVVW